MEQLTFLDELSQKIGIQLSFVDANTNIEYVADEKTKKTICKSMGYPADTNNQAEHSLEKFRTDQFSDFAPFSRVIQEWETKPFTIELVVDQAQEELPLSWVLTREDGTSETGTVDFAQTDLIDTQIIGKKTYHKRRIAVILNAPQGYHNLTFLLNGVRPETNYQTRLIVVSQKCYMPKELETGKRVWGFPIQLYAIKSNHNWGMGDFTDLKNFAPIAKNFGASLIGVNPLNALFSDCPEDASPYSSSARVFLNPLYIDTDAVPEADQSLPYQEYKNSPRFVELLTYSNSSAKVEYTYVAEMKQTAMGLLFDTFKAVNFDADYKPLTARGQAFMDFCDEHGQKLVSFAVFQTMRNVRITSGLGADCWWNWAKGYEDPYTEKSEAFRKEYEGSIWFIKYQQFVAFEQYKAAAEACHAVGMSVGLYTDLPVGVGENSAEVWSNQSQFLRDVTVGAPADIFNKKGQEWSLAGFNPIELKKNGYDLFVRIIRSVMQGAGAVRIDHAFGLSRLFLRVKKASGAYLTYSFKDMMGIVALESVRQKCIVIAEDLGTAPVGFSALMRESNALSFGIFHLKKNADGFVPPNEYEHNCLISSGTHDLPTYAAFWKGLDLELAKKMKTISIEQYQAHVKNRLQEREQFVKAFTAQGLPMEDETASLDDIMNGRVLPAWFIPNTYAFLARTNSMLLLVRIEDIVEQEEQMNLPGTYLQYPNWRYKVPILLEAFSSDERMVSLCDIINKERPE